MSIPRLLAPSGSSGPTSAARVAFELSDGTILVAAGLEVEHFEIGIAESDEREGWPQAFGDASLALAHLDPPSEVWHVVVRDNAARRGSQLRVGLLAIGRATALAMAEDAATKLLGAIERIVSVFWRQLRAVPLQSVECLTAFLVPALQPFAQSLRRRRWAPPILASNDPRDRDTRGSQVADPSVGVTLPWSTAASRWKPLADALAATADGTALVIRATTNCAVPLSAVAAAERDALAIAAARQRALSRRVGDSALLHTFDALELAASSRLSALHRSCVAMDVTLSSPAPIDAALVAVTRAVLSPARDRGDDVATAPAVMLDLHPLERYELLVPLDPSLAPDLLCATDEASALLRTFEPPTDESSPLPCSRERSLPLRGTPSEGTPIGDADGRIGAVPVTLSEEARLRHVYVVGQTGTGKSTLLLNMIVDDIRSGHGVTLLDPHGSLVSDVLDRIPRERAGDVVLIDPSDTERCTPLNPLALLVDDPVAYVGLRDRIVDDLLDTFDAIYDLKTTGGPMFEQCFRTFMSLLMGGRPQRGYTPTLPLLGVLMADTGLQKFLEVALRGDDPVTLATLDQLRRTTGDSALTNMLPYVTSKATRFYSHAAARRMLCQPSCIDFDAVLREKKILLVRLSPAHVGTEAAALLARVVVLRLGVAAMSRGVSPDAPAHFLYADEFHTFATERFATLLSEARKFRLGLVLAHQYTSQLTRRGDSHVLDAVLGNVGTTIAFRVGPRDADLLEPVFAPRAKATDIASQPDFRAVVRSSGSLGNVPFTLRTRGAPGGRIGLATAIRTLSQLRYGRDRQIVEAEIVETMTSFRTLARPGLRAAPSLP